MFWGRISYFGVVLYNINSQKYIDILDENLWPVVCKHLGDKPWFFLDDNAPVQHSVANSSVEK